MHNDEQCFEAYVYKKVRSACRPEHSTSAFRVITKARLYNFDLLKSHFIVKLGFTGVYIIFLISAQKHDCGYSLELPCRGSSNEYPQSMF